MLSHARSSRFISTSRERGSLSRSLPILDRDTTIMLYSLLTNILTLIMAILGTIGAIWLKWDRFSSRTDKQGCYPCPHPLLHQKELLSWSRTSSPSRSCRTSTIMVAFTRGMNWRSVRKKQVGPFLLCPTLYCYRRCWYKSCRPVEKDGQPNLSETSQQQKAA